MAYFNVLLLALEDQMKGDGYGTPHVLVPVIEAARAYLNFSIGRIDGGTADRELCAIAARVGWDLDAGEWQEGEAREDWHANREPLNLNTDRIIDLIEDNAGDSWTGRNRLERATLGIVEAYVTSLERAD